MLILVLIPLPSSAQTARDSWENLQQLRPGQKIEVVDMQLKSRQGTFASYSAEAISLRVKNNEVTVPRADVLRVSSREDSKRARNMLIGLAIGAGVGVAIGAAMDARVNYETGECCMGVAFLAPIGAGAGFGLGAAFPGYRTVYRAKKSRGTTSP
jgi:hypothetical protein